MIKNLTLTSTVAGALAVAASTPITAGPIPTMTAAVTQAAPSLSSEVYWRGYGWRGGYGARGYGPGLAFGLAAGALAGAALAAPYGAGSYYYYGAPAPYLYARPAYAAPYAYGPPVYAPPVYAPYGGYYYDAPSRCYTSEGYGRYRPCSAN